MPSVGHAVDVRLLLLFSACAYKPLVIGDDVWTGPYVYITDQNHGYEDPDTPIGRQVPANRPVSIGAGSWLGAGVIVLPGRRSAPTWW